MHHASSLSGNMHIAVVESLAVRLSEHADEPLRLDDRRRAAMQSKELHLEQSKVAFAAACEHVGAYQQCVLAFCQEVAWLQKRRVWPSMAEAALRSHYGCNVTLMAW